MAALTDYRKLLRSLEVCQSIPIGRIRLERSHILRAPTLKTVASNGSIVKSQPLHLLLGDEYLLSLGKLQHPSAIIHENPGSNNHSLRYSDRSYELALTADLLRYRKTT